MINTFIFCLIWWMDFHVSWAIMMRKIYSPRVISLYQKSKLWSDAKTEHISSQHFQYWDRESSGKILSRPDSYSFFLNWWSATHCSSGRYHLTTMSLLETSIKRKSKGLIFTKRYLLRSFNDKFNTISLIRIFLTARAWREAMLHWSFSRK